MVETSGNHNLLVLETRKEEVNSILLIDENKNEEALVTFKEIRKVHEVNNHKGKEQLIHAYMNVELINLEVVRKIRNIINNCKICQKLIKSVSKPKVTLSKSTDFNQAVTMDLKCIVKQIYSLDDLQLHQVYAGKVDLK